MSDDFTPAPKGPPRAKKPRKYLPRNTKPIARSSWLPRSTKPIPQENLERQARQAKRSAKKQRAFLKSDVRRLVDERADDQCEFAIPLRLDGSLGGPLVDMVRGHAFEWESAPEKWIRCGAIRGIEGGRPFSYHHAGSYKGYGGNENPRRVILGCMRCHSIRSAQDGKQLRRRKCPLSTQE